ncbi:hypothetical protein [Dolichospermum phage Dfl-JY45]
MTESDVAARLRAVTETVLDEMQRAGWFLEASRVRQFDRPTEWDINCGWCEDWAMAAAEAVGGEVVDLGDLGMDPDEWSHIILVRNGRFYDAQDPDGVEELEALHLVRGVTRAEWLAARSEPCRSPAMG